MSDSKVCKNCVNYAEINKDLGQCYCVSVLYSLFRGMKTVYRNDSCEKFEQVKKCMADTNCKEKQK